MQNKFPAFKEVTSGMSFIITLRYQIRVDKYEDAFEIYPNKALSIIKVRIIKALIQIQICSDR